MQGVSLTHPVLASFLSREFLLHIPCCLHFMFIRMEFLRLAHHMLASFLCGQFPSHISSWLRFLSGEFLLHIPCLASFSVWGVSVSYRSPAWLYLVSGEFLLLFPCWLCCCCCCCCLFSFLIWGVSLTHPMLASFFCGSFSYTSRPC